MADLARDGNLIGDPLNVKVVAAIWLVIVNVLRLTLIVSLLNAGQTRGQTLVVSVLVLIYLSIRGHAAELQQSLNDVEIRAVRLFVPVAKLLDDGQYQAKSQELKEYEEAAPLLIQNFMITSVFQGVCWIIALRYLIPELIG